MCLRARCALASCAPVNANVRLHEARAEMSLGHRFFVVDEHSAVRLSQKTFNEFFFRRLPALPGYAGGTLVVAMVVYELENRKPTRIIRIDTHRFRVNADGSMEREHMHDGMRLAMDRGFGAESREHLSTESPNVIDAKHRFNERRWKQHHPEVPGPVFEKMLVDLFGASR